MEHDLVPYGAVTRLAANAVLVLAPHADDEVFGCGGAIRLHVLQGCAVHVVVLTDGAGYGDVHVRESESEAAALVLGYERPEFWRLPDRGVEFGGVLVDRVLALIKAQRIDLVYAPSPWEVHPDHRQVSQIAITAVQRATQAVRLAFYEVGAPLRPNVLLDITSVLDTKKDAMRCFVSQMKHQDYAKHILALNTYRTYTLGPEVIAAEGLLLLNQLELPLVNSANLDCIITMGVRNNAVAELGLQTLVTVIVLSKSGRHLSTALDSIATQNFASLEVIVAAIGRQALDLPDQCGRFNIRTFTADHQFDLGRAVKASSGEFVLFLNEDDWILPGHISALLRYLVANRTVLAAHSGHQLVDAEGIPTGDTVDLPLTTAHTAADTTLPLGAMLIARGALPPVLPFSVATMATLSQTLLQWVNTKSCVVHVPGATLVHRSKGTETPPLPLRRLSALIQRLRGM